MADVTGYIPVAGDCGHTFKVPFAQIDEEFVCPVCGQKDRFSEKQINFVKEKMRAAEKSQ